MSDSVFSIDDLKKAKNGEIVPIEGFNGEDYINVRLRRPSLLSLASSGKIPNELLQSAYELFYGDGKKDTSKDKVKDYDFFKENAKVYKLVAKEALIEPKYEDLEKNGIELNDIQLLEIWQYVNQGGKALKNFRKAYCDIKDSEIK